MSLIQEALKRQREESGKAPPANAPVPPPMSAPAPPTAPAPVRPPPMRAAPPPVPAPVSAPSNASAAAAPSPADPVATETPHRQWLPLIGIMVLVLALLGGGLWLLMFAFQKWGESKSAQTLVSVPPSAAAPAETPAVVPPPAPVEPVAPPRTPPAAEPASPPASPSTPGAVAASEAPPVPTTSAPVAAVAIPDRAPPAPAVLEWPALRITGVIGRGTRGAATINGRIVAVGERIEGVEIVSVGEYGVRLVYRGETRVGKVGSIVE